MINKNLKKEEEKKNRNDRQPKKSKWKTNKKIKMEDNQKIKNGRRPKKSKMEDDKKNQNAKPR